MKYECLNLFSSKYTSKKKMIGECVQTAKIKENNGEYLTIEILSLLIFSN